jgi:hypothetical protein
MPRPKTKLEVLTPGQLARRWGLGIDRVRRLIQTGRLPGAFKVPSAGRYGETVRIPLAAVLQAEKEWAIASKEATAGRKPTDAGDGQ